MKKTTTVAAASKGDLPGKLTIGLDLGDRWSWYCVLDEAGEVVQEQKVATTPKAMRQVFAAMPHSRVALENTQLAPSADRSSRVRMEGWRQLLTRRRKTFLGNRKLSEDPS